MSQTIMSFSLIAVERKNWASHFILLLYTWLHVDCSWNVYASVVLVFMNWPCIIKSRNRSQVYGDQSGWARAQERFFKIKAQNDSITVQGATQKMMKVLSHSSHTIKRLIGEFWGQKKNITATFGLNVFLVDLHGPSDITRLLKWPWERPGMTCQFKMSLV